MTTFTTKRTELAGLLINQISNWKRLNVQAEYAGDEIIVRGDEDEIEILKSLFDYNIGRYIKIYEVH